MWEYVVLFGWSFLAATVLPIGSEVALAGVVRHQQALVLPVLVATAGNYLGACTTYWLGRRAARLIDERKPVGKGHERAARLLKRWGQPALALSWVPVIGDALVALAGALEVPFGPFSAWVILGKAARYLVLGWAILQL